LHEGTFAQLQAVTDYLLGLNTKQNGSARTEERAEQPETKLATAPRSANPKDEEPKSSKRFLGEFATYRYYFGSVPRWYPLVFAAFILLPGGTLKLTELLLSFWTGHVGAAAAEQMSANSNSAFYLGLYGMLAGLAMIDIVGAAYFFLIIMAPLSSEVLHARLLKSVVDAPLAFFSKTDVGVVMNRFSQDMSVIDTELPFALVDLAINMAITLFAAVLMCIFSGYFAATLGPLLVFFWALQKFYLKTSRQMRILDLEAKSTCSRACLVSGRLPDKQHSRTSTSSSSMRLSAPIIFFFASSGGWPSS